VAFIEVAELEMIEAKNTDTAINLVKHQIRDFNARGYELGLHIHPQWYNARYENSEWRLDYSEYNLCTLPEDRMRQILQRSIKYMRRLISPSEFFPFSFRAGNWLLQPTKTIARVLSEHAIKLDSSVYKGGLKSQHKLDYRKSQKNGYYWPFAEDVNTPDPQGSLIELPTYTRMAPAWKLLSAKRIGVQQKSAASSKSRSRRLSSLRDLMRLWQPIKMDFCRLTIEQMTQMLDNEIRKDRENPSLFRPIVAIGHTKDLYDFATVEAFLFYLRSKNIPISTFRDVYDKCSYPI